MKLTSDRQSILVVSLTNAFAKSLENLGMPGTWSLLTTETDIVIDLFKKGIPLILMNSELCYVNFMFGLAHHYIVRGSVVFLWIMTFG